MKKFLFLPIIAFIGGIHAQAKITVSILNKTEAPFTAQVQNNPSSLQTIQPNVTGFIRVASQDVPQILLFQKSSGKLGVFTRSGIIPTVSLTNYSFQVSVDQANNLIAIPTNTLMKPNIYGAGIRGRL